MWTLLKKVAKDATTLSDGVTYCVGRIFAVFTATNAIFLSGWDVIVQHSHFDLLSYGAGTGSLAVGIGALLKIKASTEPDAAPARVETARVSTPGESVAVTTATDAGVKP